jgi:hypothetical protein
VQCIKGEFSASAFVILDGASVILLDTNLSLESTELGCGLYSGLVASDLAGFRTIPLPSLPPMRTSPIGCISFDKRALRVSALRLNFTHPSYVTRPWLHWNGHNAGRRWISGVCMARTIRYCTYLQSCLGIP